MSEIIQVICDHCGSKLNAKPELLGQVRKCPKCLEPVLIQRPPTTENTETTVESVVPSTTHSDDSVTANSSSAVDTVYGGPIGTVPRPARLDPLNRYCIVGTDRLVAHWEMGKGWLLNIGSGFSSAKQNPTAIPDQGVFTLVELVIQPCEQGKKLTGMNLFRLGSRGCLTALTREDKDILSRIDGVGQLLRPQKNFIYSFLTKHFMYDFLENSKAIVSELVGNS